MALDVFYVSSSFHPVSSCTLCFAEALEVHDLARTQELDDVVDVGIVGKAQDVIVGHARLLLCCAFVRTTFPNRWILSEEKHEETIELERPFGDSWFSEKAHTDVEMLKKEFRELAKKYHPDVSAEAQAADIFKEISAEYDLLQE